MASNDASDPAGDSSGKTGGPEPLDDIKAKMREALERKRSSSGVHKDGPLKEKAHGSEVSGGGPKVHRRKAGGGGS